VQPVNAPFHRPHVIIGHRSARGHDIAARHRIGGIRQPGGERGIGRQYKEAGARHVESSDSHQAVRIGAERVEDGPPSFGVTLRRNHATRFMEGDRSPRRRSCGAPSDRDCPGVRLDQPCRIGDDAPGYRDEAVPNHPLRVGARGKAELGKRAIEPDLRPHGAHLSTATATPLSTRLISHGWHG